MKSEVRFHRINEQGTTTISEISPIENEKMKFFCRLY